MLISFIWSKVWHVRFWFYMYHFYTRHSTKMVTIKYNIIIFYLIRFIFLYIFFFIIKKLSLWKKIYREKDHWEKWSFGKTFIREMVFRKMIVNHLTKTKNKQLNKEKRSWLRMSMKILSGTKIATRKRGKNLLTKLGKNV